MDIADPMFRQKGIPERTNHMNDQPALVIKAKGSKVGKILWQQLFKLWDTKE